MSDDVQDEIAGGLEDMEASVGGPMDVVDSIEDEMGAGRANIVVLCARAARGDFIQENFKLGKILFPDIYDVESPIFCSIYVSQPKV